MDEPAEWRALAAKFSELVENNVHTLYATHYAPSTNIPWSLDGMLNRAIHSWFQSLAERGAVLLGQAAGPTAMFYWLDLLKESPYYYVINHRVEQSGVVEHVCAASAAQCYKLETLALARAKSPQELEVAPPIAPTAQYESHKAETIAEQIERLREECRLTIEELAEELRIESRSVYRHLSGQAIPRTGHIGAYERVFSERLGRKVLISKTSGKRQ